MIDVKRIYPECNSDTLLCELILQRGKLNHLNGISKVASALERFNDHSRPVLGMVDSDRFKRLPRFFLELKIMEDRESADGLVLKKHPAGEKYVVFICPEFEPWILNQAKISNINPIDFGYNNIKALENDSKPNDLRSNPKYKKFVNSIVMANPSGIQTLRNWFDKIFPEGVS